MHGPTYMANPLACSAALASLELFESEPRIAQATHIENILHEALEQCAGLPGVVDVRTKGAIGVVQLDKTRMDPQWFRKKFVEHGCWIRPFGDIVYLMPPLVITEQDLNTLTTAVVDVVGEWSGG